MEEHVVSLEELSNDHVEIVKVPMNDKGGVLYIGSISADDLIEWTAERDTSDAEGKKSASARLIMRSLVKGEKDATRIGTPDMVPQIRKMKSANSERLLRAIFKLNVIGDLRAENAAKNG